MKSLHQESLQSTMNCVNNYVCNCASMCWQPCTNSLSEIGTKKVYVMIKLPWSRIQVYRYCEGRIWWSVNEWRTVHCLTMTQKTCAAILYAGVVITAVYFSIQTVPLWTKPNSPQKSINKKSGKIIPTWLVRDVNSVISNTSMSLNTHSN